MKKKLKLVICLSIACLIMSSMPIDVVIAKSIKLSSKSVTLYVGKTKTIKLKGTTKKPKWSSSKKSVATVSKKGKITAKKQGTAVITAKLGEKKYSCKVKVKKKSSAPSKTSNTTAETSYATGNVKFSFPYSLKNLVYNSALGGSYTIKQVDVIANPMPDTKYQNEVLVRFTGKKLDGGYGKVHVKWGVYDSSGKYLYSRTTLSEQAVYVDDTYIAEDTIFLPDGNYSIKIE